MAYRISEEELLNELRRIDEIVDGSPSASDMTDIGKFGVNTYSRRFDSWNDALDEAGIRKNKRRDIPDDELLEELRRIQNEIENPPSTSTMNERGKFSDVVYLKRFGSWNEALQEVGIEPDFHQNINREELINELISLEKELGQVPRYEQMDEHSNYGKSTFERYFGSWNNALEEAGFELNKLRDGNRRNIEYGPSWCTENKRKVLMRDNYRCQCCLVSEKELGQRPDLHHIKPVRYWNVEKEHKEMNSPCNLVCLCRGCHRRFQNSWVDSSPEEFIQKARKELEN